MPKARGTHRRSDRWSRVKIVAAGVAGVLGILLGLGMLGVAIARWGERTDYLVAGPCGTAESDLCVRRVQGVVTGKRVWRGRSDSYDVSLRLHDAPLPDLEVTVELPVPDDVWPLLRRGYPVTALLWGHDVAALEVEGVRAETDDSPAIEPIQFAVYGLFVLIVGAVGVAHAMDQVERTMPVVASLFAATVVAALMMEPFDVYDPAALASVFAFVLGGLVALVVLRQQVRR